MMNFLRIQIPAREWSRRLSAISVRNSIVGGFGLLLIIMVVLFASAIWMQKRHAASLAETKVNARTALVLEDVHLQTTIANLLIERYLVTGNESEIPQIRTSMAIVRDNLAEARLQEELRGVQNAIGIDDNAEVERLGELATVAADTLDIFEQVITLRQSGDQEGARQVLEDAVAQTTAFGLAVAEAAEAERAEIPVLQSQADQAGRFATWLLIIAGAGGTAMGLAVSVFIARSILRPLSSVESVALAVAGGDLEARAEPKGPQELARLGACLNQMTDSLVGLHRSQEEKVRQLEAEVAERKRAEATISHLAYYDPLTGLPNRTLLIDRLTVALAQARRSSKMLAVMFVDLDRFKLVNDTVGHSRGDELLRSVGTRLKGLVREADTVARLGGDEFVLLLTEIERASDALELAQRIHEDFKRPRMLAGHEFCITPSTGIAIFPVDGDDAETLLANADIAMYHVKEHGKNSYRRFSPVLSEEILERLALENDLRHGLQREELVVHYQPQVNIKTGQITGMEALVRWQHPTRGLVSPMGFIPVAEETGLIVPLGEWVLRTACAQTKAWLDAGFPPVRVAVNLSAQQFQKRDLVEKMKQVLRETGLDACFLELEITEGVAIQDVDYAVMMLGQLKEMGIQIAIDDFGTGHSSLSYLKRFPIDVVKIDRSFIGGITTDHKDAGLTATIISMAHNLKLDVIAEGVETEEQLAFLRQRFCDKMQGYLFSKPVPAEKFEEMLAQSGRSKAA